jgi:cell wall-associated NlpC family hydrolase
MVYGICILSIVPCRKEASGKSEMVTQLLFGEHYTVLEDTGDWIRIITAFDEYECWISAKQHTRISDQTFKNLSKHPQLYTSDLVQVMHNKLSNTGFPVTIGSVLPLYNKHQCSFDAWLFGFDGVVCEAKKTGSKELIHTSLLFMNAPYLWGGKSPFGIDCSGFTQLVFKLNGIKLPRDSQQQVELGHPLSFVEEAEAGDLAFFDNEEGRIVHVGILLDNKQIIHASGSVRIDKFDHYGIFNTDMGKYSHMLRVIKRILR